MSSSGGRATVAEPTSSVPGTTWETTAPASHQLVRQKLQKFLPAKNQLRNKSLVVWGFSITSINFGKLYQLTLLCLEVFQGSNSNFNHSSSSSQRPCPLTHLFQHHSRMPGLSRPLSFRRLLPKFAFPRRATAAASYPKLTL